MPDSRFFQRSQSRTLGELAPLAQAALAPGADPDLLIEDVAPLDQAGPGQISFLDNVRYRDQFKVTKAAACIVTSAMAPHAPAGTALLLTEHPYKAYARVAQIFYPDFPQRKPEKPDLNATRGLHVHPEA